MYFETMFNANNLNWTKTFILTRVTTYNTYFFYICFFVFFQYKILHNILLLHKKLNLFGITESPLCSYSNTYNETQYICFVSAILLNIYGYI